MENYPTQEEVDNLALPQISFSFPSLTQCRRSTRVTSRQLLHRIELIRRDFDARKCIATAGVVARSHIK